MCDQGVQDELNQEGTPHQESSIEYEFRGRTYYDHRESIPFNNEFAHILADLPDETFLATDRDGKTSSVSYGLRSTISKKTHRFKNLSLISKHSGFLGGGSGG